MSVEESNTYLIARSQEDEKVGHCVQTTLGGIPILAEDRGPGKS